MMWMLIRVDLKKAFSNSRFYVSLFGFAILVALNGLPTLINNAHPTTEGLFLSTNSYGMIMFIFVFCIAGGGFFFCAETKAGNLPYVVMRSNVGSYTGSKVVTSALCGFLILGVGLLLDFLFYGILLMFRYGSFLGTIDNGQKALQMLTEILFISLLGAILSVLGFFTTTIFPNYFVGVTVPIIVYYMVLSLSDILHLPPELNIPWIYFSSASSMWNSFLLHFIYALLLALLLCWLMGIGCIHMIERRLEHA